jgi:hypothetical protein
MVRITLPVKAELKGEAKSGFDADTIRRRLAALGGRTDGAAAEEVAFLERLLAELAGDKG